MLLLFHKKIQSFSLIGRRTRQKTRIMIVIVFVMYSLFSSQNVNWSHSTRQQPIELKIVPEIELDELYRLVLLRKLSQEKINNFQSKFSSPIQSCLNHIDWLWRDVTQWIQWKFHFISIQKSLLWSLLTILKSIKNEKRSSIYNC